MQQHIVLMIKRVAPQQNNTARNNSGWVLNLLCWRLLQEKHQSLELKTVKQPDK